MIFDALPFFNGVEFVMKPPSAMAYVVPTLDYPIGTQESSITGE
jgi:hypothetical protein